MKIILSAIVLSFIPICFAGQSAINKQNRLEFIGDVIASSCQISIDEQSPSSLYLSSISNDDMANIENGTYLKPRGFNITLSNCVSENFLDRNDYNEIFDVYWLDAEGVNHHLLDASGSFLNLHPRGAKNMAFALSVEDSKKIDSHNLIVPASERQLKPLPERISADKLQFQYYIGYLVNNANKIKTGPIVSFATYNVLYY